jgi:hypothetical protein
MSKDVHPTFWESMTNNIGIAIGWQVMLAYVHQLVVLCTMWLTIASE